MTRINSKVIFLFIADFDLLYNYREIRLVTPLDDNAVRSSGQSNKLVIN